MSTVKAYAASGAGQELKPFEYNLGPIGADEVDIKIHSSGMCHSDLSMLKNDWGMTQYPFVPGHEVVGEIEAMGEHVKSTVSLLKQGQKVGVGWFSKSCMTCDQCMNGQHNLCAKVEGIIVGRHGGFANRVRVHWSWVTPLPSELDLNSAGPLFCGGITVFNPILQYQIKPTDKVGVVGVGGLGHLALQFLNKWGCEVTAFTSSSSKTDELKKLGAHKVVASNKDSELEKIKSYYDFIMVTGNHTLNWGLFLQALAPKGKLHFVGAVPEAIPVAAFSLIGGQKQISGSPLGSPYTIRTMLEFCARHKIGPQIETFPLSKVNDAFKRLESGKARYRIVLKNDL